MSGIGMSTLAAVAATLWAGAGCVCATAEVAPEISATVTASSPITDSIRLFLKIASKEFRSGRKVPHNTLHKDHARRHAHRTGHLRHPSSRASDPQPPCLPKISLKRLGPLLHYPYTWRTSVVIDDPQFRKLSLATTGWGFSQVPGSIRGEAAPALLNFSDFPDRAQALDSRFRFI